VLCTNKFLLLGIGLSLLRTAFSRISLVDIHLRASPLSREGFPIQLPSVDGLSIAAHPTKAEMSPSLARTDNLVCVAKGRSFGHYPTG
jgi:hypothetical protein